MASAVAVAENGDVIVTGSFTMRLDASGNVIWAKNVGGNAVAIAENGDVIVAGYTWSFGAGKSDAWVLRLDENGNVKWQKTYGGSERDYATAVAIADNGDVIVAGYTRSFGAGSRDVWVLRLDENGNVKWQKTYGGSYWEEANAVAVAENGDVIVAGYTESFGAGDDDFWVLRLPSDGNLPGCEFCNDSNAQVENTNAQVESTNAEVHDTNAEIHDTNAQIQDTNAEVKTQYYKKASSGINPLYIAAVIGLLLVGGIAAKAKGGKPKPQKPAPKENDLERLLTGAETLDPIEKAIALAEALPMAGKTSPEKEAEIRANLTSTLDEAEGLLLAMAGERPEEALENLNRLKKALSRAGMEKRARRIEENLILKLENQLKEITAKIESLAAQGRVGEAKGKYRKALRIANSHPSLREELNNAVNSVISKFLEEGDALASSGQYDRAVSTYLKAMPLAELLGKEKEVRERIDRVKAQKEIARNLEKLSELISKAKELIERRSYGEAVSVINEAMVLAPALGRAEEVESLLDSLRTRMDNLVSQGDGALEENDLTRAQKLYTEALEIAQAIGEGEEAIRERLSKLEEKRKLELLRESVRITVPEEMLHKAENEVSIIVTNKFSDPLGLTVDLSENTDYFELSEERVEFPRIRPGKTIGESVTVKPRFLGDFDFTVKVESEKGSLSHTFPVRVSRTARVSARTPTPLTSTPILNPVEALQELYSDFQYIGEGGFARVYKAKRKDGRVIALKIPKTLDPAIGRAFVREITNWLHLKHPNIVELYDVNVLPVPYLEMEYCESSLAKLRKPLPVDEASLIVFNIAEGLKYAHSKKIVHRDLKPSNVLLKNGLPKISDWGLSKVLEESMSATTTTSFTPFYAAPEQIDKKFGHTDERTDIWQLGVIFYELVTGRLPFEGSLSQVMMGILRDDPVPPGQINPEAKEVEPIIMKMLAKRKEERYQSVEELQRDLARVLNMTYSEGLRKSKTLGDRRRAAYYLTELLLINLKTNNAGEAYKYASDLAFYVGGELKDEVRRLADQIKFRLEEGLEIPPELVEKAEIIVHRVRVGFEKP
nr:protein kinase [Thermococcus gammatolerans]